MQRFVLRMFADEWRLWLPAIGVMLVTATLIGLCVHQFAWTASPGFVAAATAGGTPISEFRILSVTVYTVVALVSWTSLTIIGRASVEATREARRSWVILGAAPRSVFAATMLVLGIVSWCGAVLGSFVATALSFTMVPRFDAAVAPDTPLPPFTVAPWAPVVTIVLAAVTTVLGGLVPAARAARTPPDVTVRPTPARRGPLGSRAVRLVAGACCCAVTVGMCTAASAAGELDVTTPGAMFNLAIDAGVSALAGIVLWCPELVRVVLWSVRCLARTLRLTTPVLGARAARDRFGSTTGAVSPLVAGLGGVGALLCAVDSVGAVTAELDPGTTSDLSDVWLIVLVTSVLLLATSGAVVALAARGRGQEIALLRAAGARASQVWGLVAAESFAIALATTVAAAVPVIACGTACALVARSLIDDALVVWPVGAVLIGFAVSWAALFVILLSSVLGAAYDEPGTRLRRALP